MATLAAAGSQPNSRYMLGLLLVLTLGNGVVGFDRQTVAYLAPFIVADLGLTNAQVGLTASCLLYTSPSPRDRTRSRMPSSA